MRRGERRCLGYCETGLVRSWRGVSWLRPVMVAGWGRSRLGGAAPQLGGGAPHENVAGINFGELESQSRFPWAVGDGQVPFEIPRIMKESNDVEEVPGFHDDTGWAAGTVAAEIEVIGADVGSQIRVIGGAWPFGIGRDVSIRLLDQIAVALGGALAEAPARHV